MLKDTLPQTSVADVYAVCEKSRRIPKIDVPEQCTYLFLIAYIQQARFRLLCIFLRKMIEYAADAH